MKKRYAIALCLGATFLISATTSNTSFSNETTNTVVLNGIQVDDEYKFDHNVVIRYIAFEKGKEVANQPMTMYFSTNSENFGMKVNSPEVGDSFIIYDHGNKKMHTLVSMQGQKMGMSTSLDDEAFAVNESDNTDVMFTKTGNTKTISGYSCEEYLMEDGSSKDDLIQRIWMTTDVDVNWMEIMSSFGKSGKSATPTNLPDNFPEGAMIQMEVEDEKGNPSIKMVVDEVNIDKPQSISTSGYTFMNMGGGMSPKY